MTTVHTVGNSWNIMLPITESGYQKACPINVNFIVLCIILNFRHC